MTVNTKKLILENSHWRDERHMIKNRQGKIRRKRYLFDFRAKVLKYEKDITIKLE